MAETYKDHLYALIIAGGGGTRLWPRSRNKTPKQFLKLFGDQTLFQITSYRFNKIIPWNKILAVTTSHEYKKEILMEVPKFLPENIIVEPTRRNTAIAHAIGALHILLRDENAVILNESADHLVSPVTSYLRCEKIAAQAAWDGDWLVSVGIKPTYPNTGYGYVKKGARVKIIEGKAVFKLAKFAEKPELRIAEKYVKSNDYYWNANQYVWRADSFLRATEKYTPDIYRSLEEIKKVISTPKESEVMRREYEKVPDISVDYAISEKANNFLLVTADFNWTDIGDWGEVWGNSQKDGLGNVILDGGEEGGEVINIDTSDALIHKSGRLIAVIDVDNVVIVDTKDALLVCSKSRAQNVKQIVEEIKRQKKTNYL